MADQDTVSFKKLLKETHFLTQISIFAFSKMPQKNIKTTYEKGYYWTELLHLFPRFRS